MECTENDVKINYNAKLNISIEEETTNYKTNDSSEQLKSILILDTSVSKGTKKNSVIFQDSNNSTESIEISIKSEPIKATRMSSRKRKSTKMVESINASENCINEIVKLKKKPSVLKISKKDTVPEHLLDEESQNNSSISQDKLTLIDNNIQNEIKDNVELHKINKRISKKRLIKNSNIDSKNEITQDEIIKPLKFSRRNKKISLTIEDENKLHDDTLLIKTLDAIPDKIKKRSTKAFKNDSNKIELQTCGQDIQSEKSFNNNIKEEPLKTTRRYSRRTTTLKNSSNVIKNIEVNQKENKNSRNSSKDKLELENITKNKTVSSSKKTRVSSISNKIDIPQLEEILPKKNTRNLLTSQNSVCKKKDINELNKG